MSKLETIKFNGVVYDLSGGGTGLTADIKTALLACFANVAWEGTDGQQYYDALENALYPPANLTDITAVYTQSGMVYDTDSLDMLRGDLVVTANYSDTEPSIVTNYALSGTLTAGVSTIIVAYGGKETSITVNVTHDDVGGWDVKWTYKDGAPKDNGYTEGIDGGSSASNNKQVLRDDGYFVAVKSRITWRCVFGDAADVLNAGGGVIEVAFSVSPPAEVGNHYPLAMYIGDGTNGICLLFRDIRGTRAVAIANKSWTSSPAVGTWSYGVTHTARIIFDCSGAGTVSLDGNVLSSEVTPWAVSVWQRIGTLFTGTDMETEGITYKSVKIKYGLPTEASV